ncbi:hypothetical protein GW17_00060528 [Ensete ventricosum]|nr:hypothetical protein GW17_00060528 [Ensete ventricosum]
MHDTTQNGKWVNRSRDYAASSGGRTLVCHERLVVAVAVACRKRSRKRQPRAPAAGDHRIGRSRVLVAAQAATTMPAEGKIKVFP